MRLFKTSPVATALALAALSSLATGAQTPPAATPAATSPATAPVANSAAVPADPVADDASSYAVGMSFGMQLRGGGIERAVNPDPLVRGLKDALGGRTITKEEQERAKRLVQSGRQALTYRNRQAAQDFLAKNATAEGVVTTASGLQYRVFEKGDSKATPPALHDRVTVNYRGRLIDGTEFDNSDAHTQAAVFTVGNVLKGWNEALLLMKPGAKWRLFLPPELAYDASPPPIIPPGAALIFDLELVKVESPAPLSPPRRKDAAPGNRPAAKIASPAAPTP